VCVGAFIFKVVGPPCIIIIAAAERPGMRDTMAPGGGGRPAPGGGGADIAMSVTDLTARLTVSIAAGVQASFLKAY